MPGAPAGTLPDRLTHYLVASHQQDARVLPLTADASDRRYFRLQTPDGATRVVALHAGPIQFDALPFVKMAALLSAMPLPVPAILDHSDPLGVILLQDLGDVTLQSRLTVASPAEQAALYREAVGHIEVLQRRGHDLRSTDATPYGQAFDEEKLGWELQFFTTHFLEALHGAVLDPAARDALAREFRPIVGELAGEPRVLCHRDYHSRNLMLHDGRLCLIDFQDARLGPDTYDLVSLLRDSYVALTDAQVDAGIAGFLALRASRSPGAANPPDPGEFRRRLDLMGLQRNLKALGTFGFQAAVRGNPAYLEYVPRTLGYVRTTLARYPRFGRLHDLLAKHLDELR